MVSSMQVSLSRYVLLSNAYAPKRAAEAWRGKSRGDAAGDPAREPRREEVRSGLSPIHVFWRRSAEAFAARRTDAGVTGVPSAVGRGPWPLRCGVRTGDPLAPALSERRRACRWSSERGVATLGGARRERFCCFFLCTVRFRGE